MNQQTNDHAPTVEVLGEELGEFFAPVSSDMIDQLIGQYQAMRRKIQETVDLVMGEGRQDAIGYCLEGNMPDLSRYGGKSLERLLNPEGAYKALDADFWQRALNLTDILEVMPAKRRNDWAEQIRRFDTPAFEESTVRATLESLLAQRPAFFAERVDGVFRVLSGVHKTNKTVGFSKRMIVGCMLDDMQHPSSRMANYLNDLRAVVARFMHRDEPSHNTTYCDLYRLRERLGVWHSLDGNALRVRLYKKGTCHIEVAPDIAWRLNRVLASLYPEAIPSEFRTQPAPGPKPKHFDLMTRPLPFAVLSALRDCRPHDDWTELTVCATDKHTCQEVERVLESLGGVRTQTRRYAFDYNVQEAINHVILSGVIPDQRSHQYYPTPEHIAEAAVAAAEIAPGEDVLEPSAGQGHLARLLPQERTTCVEVAALHCQVLRAQGFEVVEGDFLAWAKSAPRFDKVVMNPPYQGGRHQAHLDAAAKLVAPGGRLVAILPATVSSHPSRALSDWEVEISTPYTGDFKGTSISVVILTAIKPAETARKAA